MYNGRTIEDLYELVEQRMGLEGIPEVKVLATDSVTLWEGIVEEEDYACD